MDGCDEGVQTGVRRLCETQTDPELLGTRKGGGGRPCTQGLEREGVGVTVAAN